MEVRRNERLGASLGSELRQMMDDTGQQSDAVQVGSALAILGDQTRQETHNRQSKEEAQ